MTQAWTEDLALVPENSTWLLEASAGTGKTYQIAGLIVRLVAEYDVKIDRILAITFTNAATAELRARIRERLQKALDALGQGAPSTGDAVFAHLWNLGSRAEMARRITTALRDFDLAPISTIHGFSQRMLTEFAFDSGQDPQLEVLASADEIHEQIVDDALATLWHEVDENEAGAFAAAGVERDTLLAVARAMCGASAPTVEPIAGDVDAARSLLHCLPVLRAWTDRVAAFRARWSSDEAKRAFDSLREDVDADLFNQKSVDPSKLEAWIILVTLWLTGGAPGTSAKDRDAYERLGTEKLGKAWKKNPKPAASRPWWKFFETYDAFLAEHTTFLADFAPLAPFAVTVRARVEAELARRGCLTFDAMLSNLAERVKHEGYAHSPIARRIRERFHVALVDEFQDTDDSQWTVLKASFLGTRRLFLIGDPKQAIYAFRGADVYVYLAAARSVDKLFNFTMAHNWRSDPGAVASMNHLWRAGSGSFDQEGVEYVEVSDKLPCRLAPPGSSLVIRWTDASVQGGIAGEPIPRKIVAEIAGLAAREAVLLLTGEHTIAVDGTPRGIVPGDIAVLVNEHAEADAVRNAFARAGVPAVAASRTTVFDAPVAGWMASWLDALGDSWRDRSARTAAVTPLFGWTADELAWSLGLADGTVASVPAGIATRDWNAWTERLRIASARWSLQGFARVFDREATALDVYPRLLAMPDGERHATDLRHLFEILHTEERTRRCGPGALATWLREQAGVRDEARTQRLESDSDAVTVATVHVSKGLEYPIVLLPFAWAVRDDTDDGRPLLVREEKGAFLHVGSTSSTTRAARRTQHREEDRRESLRKLYVSLTRARHRTIAWYGPIGRNGKKTSATALGRLLMRSHPSTGFDDAAMPDFGARNPSEPPWVVSQRRLEHLAERSAGTIAWSSEKALSVPPARWDGLQDSTSDFTSSRWPDGHPGLESGWIVTSYTGISNAVAARDRNEKAEREPVSSVDEDRHDARAVDEDEPADSSPETPEPESAFPRLTRLENGGGKAYGTWVHAVFEHLDFNTGNAKDGRTARELVKTSGASLGFGDRAGLANEITACLPFVLATPLDALDTHGTPRAMKPLPKGFALRDLERADRFDELAFDLSLGDGSRWLRAGGSTKSQLQSGCVDARGVYEAILARDASVPFPGAAWVSSQQARRDAGKVLVESIAGILTGSIDLVFRAADPVSKSTRYYFADYKTNRIGDSTAGHYTSPWLDREMCHAGYPLQSLLYTLALHRHLRTRLRDYDYDRHIGGYLYLFVRGMSGPETPRDETTGHCLGVLGDRWPRTVVEALDRAFGAKTGGAR